MSNPTPDHELLPAGLRGRYRAVERLGAGGFGRVVLADDLELGRPVAIKLLRASLLDLDMRLRFEREAQLTARLVHPHIVRIYDFGLCEGVEPYIVYEYVEGRPLAAVPADPTLSGLRRVAGWGSQVAAALAQAHRAGVLHRDVKPHNILIRSSGGAVLCDFGIARDLSPDALRTREGIILGTPEYLAPEVILGGLSTPASDQFGLAASLYRVAYGVEVYGGASVREILDLAVDAERVPEPPAGRLGIVPAVDEVVRRGLAARPTERFPDLDAFGSALGAAASSSPLPGSLLAPSITSISALASPLAAAPAVRTPTRVLGLPAPAGPGPRYRVVLAGLLVGLAVWGWRGMGGHSPGGGDHDRPPIERPTIASTAPVVPPPAPGTPESEAELLARDLGVEGKADPWLRLEGKVRSRPGDPDGLLARLSLLQADPRRDLLLLLVRQQLADPGRLGLVAAARAVPTEGLPSGWADARLRAEALACRTLWFADARGWTAESGAERAELKADLQRLDGYLAASPSPFAAAVRVEFWSRLAHVVSGADQVASPALEFARRLARLALERFPSLDPHARVALALAVQRVSAVLGSKPQRQATRRAWLAPALEVLADCPEAAAGWEGEVLPFEADELRKVQLAASLVRYGHMLPLPAGYPGDGNEETPMAEDAPPREAGRIAWQPGQDPWIAFGMAAARARDLLLDLEDDPAWRAAALGRGSVPEELLEWPRLVLPILEETVRAGRSQEALRLVRRMRAASALDMGERHRERLWGAWGRIEFLGLELEASEGEPARAAYQASELLARTAVLAFPLGPEELRALVAAWKTLGQAGREALNPSVRNAAEVLVPVARAAGIQ